MAKDYKEWFDQSEYDYETANVMFNYGRYFYSVFMCHLSIEKALKGLYVKKTDKLPPKIHKLNYFVE
jgi:HEPN domain-containing protein